MKFRSLRAADGERMQRIRIVAKKFEFSRPEIRVRKGVPVTLKFSSLDFVHGFSLPDLNLRADLIPGKTVQVSFTPQKAGEFDFLCDNFCGEGHERMHGRLIVTE